MSKITWKTSVESQTFLHFVLIMLYLVLLNTLLETQPEAQYGIWCSVPFENAEYIDSIWT